MSVALVLGHFVYRSTLHAPTATPFPDTLMYHSRYHSKLSNVGAESQMVSDESNVKPALTAKKQVM